ncbi:MAG TPA: type III-B CRISPR module-associated protein Cmr3 [Thioploca sp.]|nr:type III-B CRISPR module-associated protein Cmr3 [Thioploca sp.]
MSAKQWCFEPLDTWFFRESRPFGTVGGSELTSLFPPPARTVAGAIRTLIGENANINWNKYKNGEVQRYKGINLLTEIGGADDFGKLRLTGPYLIYNEQRLYPVPLSLLEKDNDFKYLQIGGPVHCDLGEKVQLPILKERGAKPLENAWLTEPGLRQVLAGELPAPITIIRQSKLFANEPRLGIARNNAKRITGEGLLYQTQHIRPTENVKVAAILHEVADVLQPNTGQVRFGGEGRLAAVTVTKAPSAANFKIPTDGQNVLLMLLTPADLGADKNSWLPSPEFQKTADKKGNTVWQGTLNGVKLTLLSAVLGKTVREGGWDLQNECPRPVKSFMPAGSVWFCQLDDNITLAEAVKKLHGFQVGEETALGRGELAVGILN